MLAPRTRELLVERRDEPAWERRDSVLLALAVAYQELAALEVEVLHAYAGALEEA